MPLNKNKVQLSPRLKLGVGRRPGPVNYTAYLTALFFAIGAVLAVRAGYVVFKTTTGEVKPQVLGASTTVDESTTAFNSHTVKKGDTVFSIGQQYGVEWTVLATLNHLEPPFNLKPGQTIKVPAK